MLFEICYLMCLSVCVFKMHSVSRYTIYEESDINVYSVCIYVLMDCSVVLVCTLCFSFSLVIVIK